MCMKKLAYRLTDIYISAMLLVFPLWTGFDGYANITAWKFRLYAALTLLWAAAVTIAAIAGRARVRLPLPFALCLGLYLLWAGVCCLASPFELTPMGWQYNGLAPLALYALTALGCAAFGVMRERYVYLLSVSVTLCCALALIQLTGANPFGLYPEGLNYYDSGVWYSGSFLGTLGNTNLLGAFLCLASPLIGFYAVEKGGKRLWLLIPAVLGVVTIALSKSEAGLVGAAAGVFVGIPYYVYKRGRGRAAVIVLAAECALGLAALAAVYFLAPASGTLHELSELLHGRVDGSFGSHRVAIWGEALRLFGERPLLGGGPGSFGLRSTLEFSRYVSESGLTMHTRADNAHCELLTALTELGVPGALLWLGLWAAALAAGFRRHGALALALLSYLAQSFFGIGSCFVLPLVYMLLGLAAAEPAGGERKRAGRGRLTLRAFCGKIGRGGENDDGR